MTRPWPFVRSVHRFEVLDSTSDQARRMLDDDALELPGLIWAARQTRGRGQGSNSWWSDSGSLTATVVLDPSSLGISPDREPMVALATATAVIEAIGERYRSCRAGIRWPNDVEVGGRKLGGILPERAGTPEAPRLLIGIGLNVETRLEGAPGEIRGMATSLAEWESTKTGNEPIEGMLFAILEGLGSALRELAVTSPGLAARWNDSDTLAGRPVRVEIGDRVIEGVAEGIDNSGGLRIRREGRVEVLHAGRVLRN